MNINCNPLELEEYQDLIQLNEPYLPPNPVSDTIGERETLVDDLLTFLNPESLMEIQAKEGFESSTYELKRKKLYSLLTIRQPSPLPSWFHLKLGGLLQRELKEKQISDVNSVPRISHTIHNTSYKAADRSSLWLGDITTLKCDAIVNAANKSLLGCFRPFHRCIDNAIHTAAGPMLREDCNSIIKRQGCPEGTGWAKITRAYNLPSKFVLHTVGPIYDRSKDNISQEQKQELSNCYKSCLKLARQIPSVRTVAFCSISTGVFGFPIEAATRIALKTVENWIETNPDVFDLIIFNVFSKDDYEIHEKILKEEKV